MRQDILKEVKSFAAQAHGDQRRKYTPDPYIVHPIRVMETCHRFTEDTGILSAALLHDVLEDTPVEADEMLQFLSSYMPSSLAQHTLRLVVDLTDVFTKAAYPSLNRRARKLKELERLKKAHPDAHTIKYADILDNAREIVPHDPDFSRVFLHECKATLKVMDKGHPQLYREAITLVSEQLQFKTGNV